MNAGSLMPDPHSPSAGLRGIAAFAARALGAAAAVLVLGAAISSPSLADPGNGRGHGWGHYKHHHDDDDGPVIVYGAPPPVVVVRPPSPAVVYAPPPRVVYAPPPAVIYAPPPPQPGVSLQMNIPLR